MKNFIINILGGYTKEEIECVEKKNFQLNQWLLAFTDLTHNFGNQNPTLENLNFNDTAKNRIKKVSLFYRKFSCYRESYELMEDNMFKELQDFIFIDFNKVFCSGIFSDETYEKFEKLEKKYKKTKHK